MQSRKKFAEMDEEEKRAHWRAQWRCRRARKGFEVRLLDPNRQRVADFTPEQRREYWRENQRRCRAAKRASVELLVDNAINETDSEQSRAEQRKAVQKAAGAVFLKAEEVREMFAPKTPGEERDE